MTEKIILTDCDGVLLDWEGAFEEWMSQQGHEKKVHATYDISTTYGLEKSEGKSLVKEFNESAWMGYLKAFRDARSGVARLYEAGYRFHVITSLSLDKKAQRLRQMNLDNVFGKGVVKHLVCLDTGADKDEALAEYDGSGLWWIEDKPENAECGLRFGLKPVLIEHAHNEDHDHDDIQYVVCWNEIADLILGE
jgi:phosphoglycolate phosphatase-like HAD superfamily hydrolase